MNLKISGTVDVNDDEPSLRAQKPTDEQVKKMAKAEDPVLKFKGKKAGQRTAAIKSANLPKSASSKTAGDFSVTAQRAPLKVEPKKAGELRMASAASIKASRTAADIDAVLSKKARMRVTSEGSHDANGIQAKKDVLKSDGLWSSVTWRVAIGAVASVFWIGAVFWMMFHSGGLEAFKTSGPAGIASFIAAGLLPVFLMWMIIDHIGLRQDRMTQTRNIVDAMRTELFPDIKDHTIKFRSETNNFENAADRLDHVAASALSSLQKARKALRSEMNQYAHFTTKMEQNFDTMTQGFSEKGQELSKHSEVFEERMDKVDSRVNKIQGYLSRSVSSYEKTLENMSKNADVISTKEQHVRETIDGTLKQFTGDVETALQDYGNRLKKVLPSAVAGDTNSIARRILDTRQIVMADNHLSLDGLMVSPLAMSARGKAVIQIDKASVMPKRKALRKSDVDRVLDQRGRKKIVGFSLPKGAPKTAKAASENNEAQQDDLKDRLEDILSILDTKKKAAPSKIAKSGKILHIPVKGLATGAGILGGLSNHALRSDLTTDAWVIDATHEGSATAQ